MTQSKETWVTDTSDASLHRSNRPWHRRCPFRLRRKRLRRPALLQLVISAPHCTPIDTELSFAAVVERLYGGLMRQADTNPVSSEESCLGGKFLYAGELDGESRAWMAAGNIAGVASLAATPNPEMQQQAIREGIADFLVTSLDEALRILKNEIRKRETVAVCVALAPEVIEQEMIARGVQPDLMPSCLSLSRLHASLVRGARPLEPAAFNDGELLASWSVASAPALWLPKLDAIVAGCLGPEEWAARRWLCLAPRYLGRLARNRRLLRCHEETARRFLEQARQGVERSEIGVEVEVQLIRNGETGQHRFAPLTGE